MCITCGGFYSVSHCPRCPSCSSLSLTLCSAPYSFYSCLLSLCRGPNLSLSPPQPPVFLTVSLYLLSLFSSVALPYFLSHRIMLYLFLLLFSPSVQIRVPFFFYCWPSALLPLAIFPVFLSVPFPLPSFLTVSPSPASCPFYFLYSSVSLSQPINHSCFFSPVLSCSVPFFSLSFCHAPCVFFELHPLCPAAYHYFFSSAIPLSFFQSLCLSRFVLPPSFFSFLATSLFCSLE